MIFFFLYAVGNFRKREVGESGNVHSSGTTLNRSSLCFTEFPAIHFTAQNLQFHRSNPDSLANRKHAELKYDPVGNLSSNGHK